MQALFTRRSDALTSRRSASFLHLLLFLLMPGARRISLRVCRDCECLEMKSWRATHDWNPCSDSGGCQPTRKHDVKTGAFGVRRRGAGDKEAAAFKLGRGAGVLHRTTQHTEHKYLIQSPANVVH